MGHFLTPKALRKKEKCGPLAMTGFISFFGTFMSVRKPNIPKNANIFGLQGHEITGIMGVHRKITGSDDWFPRLDHRIHPCGREG